MHNYTDSGELYLLVNLLPEGQLLTERLDVVLEIDFAQRLCLEGLLHGIQSAADLV